jgi:hypothetical protein
MMRATRLATGGHPRVTAASAQGNLYDDLRLSEGETMYGVRQLHAALD